MSNNEVILAIAENIDDLQELKRQKLKEAFDKFFTECNELIEEFKNSIE